MHYVTVGAKITQETTRTGMQSRAATPDGFRSLIQSVSPEKLSFSLMQQTSNESAL